MTLPLLCNTTDVGITSGRGNTLRAKLKRIEFQTAVHRALLNLRKYVANSRPFYSVREHDGYSIGYRMTVVELACSE